MISKESCKFIICTLILLFCSSSWSEPISPIPDNWSWKQTGWSCTRWLRGFLTDTYDTVGGRKIDVQATANLANLAFYSNQDFSVTGTKTHNLPVLTDPYRHLSYYVTQDTPKSVAKLVVVHNVTMGERALNNFIALESAALNFLRKNENPIDSDYRNFLSILPMLQEPLLDRIGRVALNYFLGLHKTIGVFNKPGEIKIANEQPTFIAPYGAISSEVTRARFDLEADQPFYLQAFVEDGNTMVIYLILKTKPNSYRFYRHTEISIADFFARVNGEDLSESQEAIYPEDFKLIRMLADPKHLGFEKGISASSSHRVRIISVIRN